MDNQFKVSGIAFTIYGACAVLASLCSYIFGVTQLSSVQSLPVSIFLLINTLLAINFLALLCGVYPRIQPRSAPLAKLGRIA